MTTVVRVDGVTKRFGSTRALDEVSFELSKNTIHGLLGRNGAGKTTMMKVLTGQILETSGTVEVFGAHPYENADVLSRVCFISEGQRYPETYQVRHVLKVARLLYPNWDEKFAQELVDEFGLPRKRYVKKLSRGMLSAVGVIIGLASRAPLTFFDEPYLGLDAVARQLFYDRLLADYARHPRTIVLSTHLIDEVSNLIEHVVVIDQGRILIDEDADTLRRSAVTVSGPASAVESFVTGRTELHREQLGGRLRVTVANAPDQQPHGDLELEPVSLQQLIVRTTQRNRDERADTSTRRGGMP